MEKGNMERRRTAQMANICTILNSDQTGYRKPDHLTEKLLPPGNTP
jgi:hypothetical protein